MKLAGTDHFFVQLARRASNLIAQLGKLEANAFREQLDAINLQSPVFVTGLARSGTTILLEQLARTNVFATHRYRDFPFLHTPIWWNR